jgi:HEAT repeat protein
VLFIACALLVARRFGGEEPPPEAAITAPELEEVVSVSESTPLRIPYEDPTAEKPFQKPEVERYPGRYPRWNLKEFPKGWDHDLAGAIHSYFEEMEIDLASKDLANKARIAGLEAVRERFREFLAGLGPEAVPTLAAILDIEPDFVDRRFLLYALGDLGKETEEATHVLADFLMKRYEDPRARSELGHAIKAMGNLHNESSLDRLVSFIGDERLHGYRRHLVEALGEHPYRDEAVGTFVEVLREDSLPNVRNKAAQALGKIESPETLNELYMAFQSEPHWVTKQTILGSIGKIGNPSSIPFLEEQARSGKLASTRLSACGALQRLNTPYAQQVLREVARSEPDAQVRKHLETWVSQAAER